MSSLRSVLKFPERFFGGGQGNQRVLLTAIVFCVATAAKLKGEDADVC